MCKKITASSPLTLPPIRNFADSASRVARRDGHERHACLLRNTPTSSMPMNGSFASGETNGGREWVESLVRPLVVDAQDSARV